MWARFEIFGRFRLEEMCSEIAENGGGEVLCSPFAFSHGRGGCFGSARLRCWARVLFEFFVFFLYRLGSERGWGLHFEFGGREGHFLSV